MGISIKFDDEGNIVSVEPAVPVGHMKAKPIQKWGHQSWCPGEEFGSYPEDGACPCGAIKHHVHCTCGGIVQVG
jgi:hypothetical protein